MDLQEELRVRLSCASDETEIRCPRSSGSSPMMSNSHCDYHRDTRAEIPSFLFVSLNSRVGIRQLELLSDVSHRSAGITVDELLH